MKKKTKQKEKLKQMKPSIKIVPSLSDEANSAIKTTILVIAFFVLSYVCLLLLGNVGFFDAGYEAPAVEEEEIAYDTALIGTMFNRPEKVYYVALDNYGEDNLDMYFKYLVNNYAGETPIYKVDMSIGANSKYVSETGNPNAKNIEDLAIKVPTLIKIKNGKIISYIEDINKIKKELAK